VIKNLIKWFYPDTKFVSDLIPIKWEWREIASPLEDNKITKLYMGVTPLRTYTVSYIEEKEQWMVNVLFDFFETTNTFDEGVALCEADYKQRMVDSFK
jgi:hypothetical protein